MPMSPTRVENLVVAQLVGMGIDATGAGGDSETAKLVRAIVRAVFLEMTINGIIMINVPVVHPLGPGMAIGTAKII